MHSLHPSCGLVVGLLVLAIAAVAQPPEPPSPEAVHVFTADDFAATHQQLVWDDQGREVTYQLRVHEGLPVYRVRLIPDRPGVAGDYTAAAQHIGRVEISVAGSPGALQTIEVESHHGARHFTSDFEIRDVDMDGYADLGFHLDGGAQWSSHTWWLFDPASGKFVRNALSRDLDRLASNGLILDRAAGTIMAPYLDATCSLPIFDLFKIAGGRLQLVERHERKTRYETNGVCQVSVFKLKDGELTEVDLLKKPEGN